MKMTIRTHGENGKAWDYTMKVRKNESLDRFITRVYNRIADNQREVFETVRIELFETDTNIMLDTFFGLVKREAK